MDSLIGRTWFLAIGLLLGPIVVSADDTASGSDDRRASGFSKTAITLPDATWRITANTPPGSLLPAFDANRRRMVMIRLGELNTGSAETPGADDMLDRYEASTRSLLAQFEREDALPADIGVPEGWTCRAYRTALSKSQVPDSVDLACYAPYPGGTRTLMVEIKNAATTEDRAALQQALLSIKLID